MSTLPFAPFYAIPQGTLLCGECKRPVTFDPLEADKDPTEAYCRCTNWSCRRHNVKFTLHIPVICLEETK